MNEHEQAMLRELRALRSEVAAMRRPPLRHGWLKHVIHDLEYNPNTQYKVHIYAAYVWLVNIAVVLLLQLLFPDVWAGMAVLYVAIVSLYANFATDYGAASSALAAGGGEPLPVVPTEPPH